MSKDKDYSPIFKPMCILFASMMTILIIWAVADLPRKYVEVYMWVQLPFVIYYWFRFNQIRNSD